MREWINVSVNKPTEQVRHIMKSMNSESVITFNQKTGTVQRQFARSTQLDTSQGVGLI